MFKTIFLLIFIFKVFVLDAIANDCFKTQIEQEEVSKRLKAMVVCSNPETAKECRELFLAENIFATVENEVKVCKTSQVKIASTLPLATPYIAGITALGHSLSFETKREFVNSVVDFHHHTQMHKKRVTALALEAFKKYPREFAGLNEEMIIRVLSQHDNAKIDPKYRYSGKPFYEALYENYGKRPPKDLIKQLNNVDGAIMEEALKNEGLEIKDTDSRNEKSRKIKLRRKIARLEKLADFVDRAMNPVSSEEFGRKTWKQSAVAKTPFAKEMALYLENNYKKFVGYLHYKKLSSSQYFALAQKIKIDKSFRLLLNSGRTAKELGSRAIGTVTKVINANTSPVFRANFGKVLMKGSIGLELATYSPKMSCDSMVGYHDWTLDGNSCVPVYGLSEKIMSYLEMNIENQQDKLADGGHLCSILKENDNLNQADVFSNVTCSPKGARMEFSPGKSLDVKFNLEGKINEIDLQNISSLVNGVRGQHYSKIRLNAEGRVESLCHKIRNNREICRKHKEGKFLAVTQNMANFYYSMNYKIQQGVACCLGRTNIYNEKITCSI